MRLFTFQSSSGPRPGAVVDSQHVDLIAAGATGAHSLEELIAAGTESLPQLPARPDPASVLDANSIRFLPPIPHPQKVICVGLNYADHAAESGAKVGDEPVIFNKFPTAIRGHGDPIVLPRATSQVDYEAELVVVIGRGGKHIPRDAALKHVAGYCCGHDVSARDWQLQKPGGQWLLGKSFDSFAPYGPYLVTGDEVGDPGNLRIQLRVSGQTMQDSRTSQLIFGVDFLVAYLSGVCTLSPGDVIFTGTPPGVGMARRPPVFLKPGDVVEVEIEKLGVLSNSVIAEE